MTTESGAPGRPASFSKEDAIERAMNLFWQRGYSATTARDLAKAMQIQRSSFYNTFGSKEAVFEAALIRYVQLAPDSRLDEIQDDQAVVPAIVAALRELCRVRAADKHARGCLVCNSVAELVGVDNELGLPLDSALKHRIGVMEQLFARASKNGEIKLNAPVSDVARSFVSFLLGINLASKSIRSETELWAICRTFLSGIGVGDSQLGNPK